MDPRFKSPFTMVLAGPTGSGKTQFVKSLLQNIQTLVTPIPETIIFCYGEWQSTYKDIQQLALNIDFIEGLPDLDAMTMGEPKLIVIDDLMGETNDQVSRLFTKGSHHKNISVIYIVQNLFNKQKEQRTISLNSHYMVLFKNPRDRSQIIHLAKQMYPKQNYFLQEAYKMATAEPFSYLLVDLKQDTPDHLRLRGDLFQEYQTVYTPRQ